MQYFKLLAAAAATASLASASVINFQSVDDINRTIYFTPNAGLEEIDALTLEGLSSQNVTFPDTWVGNFYAVSEGAVNKPGMLGEVAFNAWNDITYFDVSAIVDPTDTNGIKLIYPKVNTEGVFSGCATFPCDNAYYQADDVQTKATNEDELICIVGTAASDSKMRRGTRITASN